MPTPVLVNLTALDPQRNGGSSHIARQVSRLLLEMPGVRPVFVVSLAAAGEFTRWLGARAVVVPMFLRPRLMDGQMRTLIETIAPGMIVSPLFGTDPFHHARLPQVASIPDALALDHPEVFSTQEAHRRRLLYDRLRRVTSVVTVSGFSSERLQKHLGLPATHIHIVRPGADGLDAPQADDASPPTGRYWLYPANLWPHKRHGLLLQALALARQRAPDVRLVLTGSADGMEALRQQAAALGLPDEALLHCGYVSSAQLHALYQRAEALMFTSGYEGFGMPLLEAMRAGCPVICAPRTAMPEVAGAAALQVQADDSPQAWANAALDELPARRDALIAAGRARAQAFSWEAARAGWREVLLSAGLAEDRSAPPAVVPDQSAALNALRLGGAEAGRMRRMAGMPWLWRAQRMMLAQAAIYADRRPPA